MFKRILLLSFLFFIITPVHALNTKNIQTIEMVITKSGVLEASGNVVEADLRLYIPQEGIELIEVTPSNWQYTTDDLGNRMVDIKWNNPSGIKQYSIKVKVKNSAKFFSNESDNWKYLDAAKRQTPLTKANDAIREWAYGNETPLEKAVRLAEWIKENIKYSFESTESVTNSAIWTWGNREGACGEFTNLFIAGLRSQGIPVRYVAGYALTNISSKENLGHAWSEVYIDGKWVPFDLTWFEAGYLDATHVVFARLLDSNYTEILNYEGSGKVLWKSNPVKINVIYFTAGNHTQLQLNLPESTFGNSVILANGTVKGNCELLDLDLLSCIGENGKPFFQVFSSNRKLWTCGTQRIFWLLKAPKVKSGYIYNCPLKLQDQFHSTSEEIKISGNKPSKMITISGPGSVKVGDRITLTTDREGLFFSPNLTKFSYGKEFIATPNKVGNFVMYFYSEEGYGEKIVKVERTKDFQLSVNFPNNVTEGNIFSINVRIENVANESLLAKVILSFENQVKSVDVDLKPNETKNISFNLTANKVGKEDLVVEVRGRTLESYTGEILVLKKGGFSIWDQIVKFFQGLFESIKKFFHF